MLRLSPSLAQASSGKSCTAQRVAAKSPHQPRATRRSFVPHAAGDTAAKLQALLDRVNVMGEELKGTREELKGTREELKDVKGTEAAAAPFIVRTTVRHALSVMAGLQPRKDKRPSKHTQSASPQPDRALPPPLEELADISEAVDEGKTHPRHAHKGAYADGAARWYDEMARDNGWPRGAAARRLFLQRMDAVRSTANEEVHPLSLKVLDANMRTAASLLKRYPDVRPLLADEALVVDGYKAMKRCCAMAFSRLEDGEEKKQDD